MSHLAPRDEKILKLLLEEGLITATQESRVRATMKRGTSLAEAIVKVPLVDPVKLASIESLASRDGAATTAIPQEPSHPTESAIPGLMDDEIGDLDIELDEDSQSISLDEGDFRFENLGPVSESPTPEPTSPEQADVALDLDLELDESPSEHIEDSPTLPEPPPAKPVSTKDLITENRASSDDQPTEEKKPPRDSTSRRARIDSLFEVRNALTPPPADVVTSKVTGAKSDDTGREGVFRSSDYFEKGKDLELNPAPTLDEDLDLGEDLDLDLDGIEPAHDNAEPLPLEDMDLDLDLEPHEVPPPPAQPGKTTLPSSEKIPKVDFTRDWNQEEEETLRGVPSSSQSIERNEFADDLRAAFEKRPLLARDEEEFGEEVESILDEAFEKKQSSSRIQKPKIPSVPKQPSGEILKPLDDPESYKVANHRLQTYDLRNDEGITLIQQVNGMFAKAMSLSASGFRIDPGRGTDNLQFFGADSSLEETETIATDMVDKIINRIKVMARIEPWRRQAAQKGVFIIIEGGIQAHAYIDTEPAQDGHETVTVHIGDA